MSDQPSYTTSASVVVSSIIAPGAQIVWWIINRPEDPPEFAGVPAVPLPTPPSLSAHAAPGTGKEQP